VDKEALHWLPLGSARKGYVKSIARVTMSPATNPGMEKQDKLVLFLWRTMSSHLKWNKHASDQPRRVPPPIPTASGTRFPYSAVLRRGTNPRSDKTNVVQG